MGFSPVSPNWSAEKAYWHDLIDHTPRDEIYGNLVLPKVGTKMTGDGAMFLAWAIALRGAGQVSPNPLVGAVLLDKEARFLSAGYHQKFGGPHAEVNAISQLDRSIDLSGATLFVTLEPCAHEGKTPSCAKMIATTQISKVVFAVADPNPLVNGQGVAILLDAGKKVEHAIEWQARCEWLIRVFLKNQKRNSIYIGLKVASTPSGVMAGDGTSRLWITGERARQMGHFLRLEYDSIAVGFRTVLLDDPMLDIRHPLVEGRIPLRLVLDPIGQILNEHRPLKILTTSPDRTLVVLPDVADDRALIQRFGVRTLKLPVRSQETGPKFDWLEIGRALWSMGLRSLLIEGGAGLYRSAMGANVVDGVHWFVGARDDSIGLKWLVPKKLSDRYYSGACNGASRGAVDLDSDKLLEDSF
jgi:diaminohydroxyphosphoribosylaminopyrimidine deaminase / 5-amino-6-(5-phosphoribosylamino)uracil reductase